MKSTLLVTLLFAATMISACGTPRVNRLTDERFPAVPADQEVKLYVNEVQRPHVKIAQVQSFADPNQDADTKRRQLQELRDTARDLGADAVMSVTQLNQQVRGMVRDERTPFPSLRQGTLDRYFLRGVAIRYVEEAEAGRYLDPLADTEAAAESRGNGDIPEVVTSSETAESNAEVLPRGLGPLFW
jgi:hypothetical protein